jgi:glycosyltransferase involved in cell wall biosynthesis
LPSEGMYETFGLVVAEAFACGVPVIASSSGVASQMVTDKRNGLHFESGNPVDLAQKVRWAWDNPAWMASASLAARREFVERFGAERNYETLISIYRQLIDRRRDPRSSPAICH